MNDFSLADKPKDDDDDDDDEEGASKDAKVKECAARDDGGERRDVDAGRIRVLGVFKRRRAAEDRRKVHVRSVRETRGVVQSGDASTSRELDV